MLEQLFPKYHTRYVGSSFSAQLRGFADWLVARGYGHDPAQEHVRRLKQVLEQSGREPGSTTFTQRELVQLFIRRRDQVRFCATHNAFKVSLAERGLLSIEPDSHPHASLLDAYRDHLVVMRGLSTLTVAQHLSTVRSFLDETVAAGPSLGELSPEAVERHVVATSQRISRQSMQPWVSRLRSFLRFCHDSGVISQRLNAIDTPRTYRHELPPRALPWKTVQDLLRSIDRKSTSGWRDYTILHLMAHYGLRPSEVVALTLSSIDWRAKTLRVDQCKTRSVLLLPLANASLRVIKRYLYHGRPGSDRPELFLRTRGPAGPIEHSTIGGLYKNRVARSGLPISASSPYSLRHSFAMRLLARGVGVKAIGDLLGHRSLESTCVYLRLHTDALRDVALSLPTSSNISR